MLLALGGASFAILDPRFTMAEMMVADDALAQLIPPALPLMIGAALVGTVLVWLAFGRRWQALVPILVTQILLVFLVGHNLAILGLVEITSDLLFALWEFAGLTVLLATGFAGGVMVVARLRSRARQATPGVSGRP